MCSASFGDLEHDGYVPYIEALGGGDYLEIRFCADCGLLQNFQPLTDRQIAAAFTGDEIDDDLDDDFDDDFDEDDDDWEEQDPEDATPY